MLNVRDFIGGIGYQHGTPRVQYVTLGLNYVAENFSGVGRFKTPRSISHRTNSLECSREHAQGLLHPQHTAGLRRGRDLSANAVSDEGAKETYFSARVVLDAEDVPREIAQKLVPGMPADVLIITRETQRAHVFRADQGPPRQGDARELKDALHPQSLRIAVG
jgi:hypothetical protein